MASQSAEIKEHIARIFKALGDTNRLDMVMSIGKKALSVSEIIKSTGLSQTLVSFHLRALREANIVTTERNGPFILYSLSEAVFSTILLELSKSVSLKLKITADKSESVAVNNKLSKRRK